MLRKQPLEKKMRDLVPHLPAYFQRNKEGWLGLAETLSMAVPKFIFSKNGRHKTSSCNRVRQNFTYSTITTNFDDDAAMYLSLITTDLV